LIDKEVLAKYINEGLTFEDIGKKLNLSYYYVWKHVHEYGLKTKSMLEKENAANLIGRKYNLLTVLERAEDGKYGHRYLCRCDCGNEKIVYQNRLLSGYLKSCGCLEGKGCPGKEFPQKALIHIGEKFGRLEVIDIARVGDRKEYKMVCKCECGNIIKTYYNSLKSGATVSCGCYHKEITSIIGTEKLKRFNGKYKWYFVKDGQKIRCRSGYEVIYANWLINNNIDFEYEPQCFILGKNKRYTPDFYLIEEDKYVELKGSFLVAKNNQKQNIDIFKQNHNFELKYWNDIVKTCSPPYVEYSTYGKRARKLNIDREDYLGQMMYLNNAV
jgi:hypothetical protein